LNERYRSREHMANNECFFPETIKSTKHVHICLVKTEY
jgi:hypothetical protein